MQINKSSYIGGDQNQNNNNNHQEEEENLDLPVHSTLDIQKESEKIEKIETSEKKEWFSAPQLIILFGFLLLGLGLLFLYWGSFRGEIPENENCNLTMLYAINNENNQKN